MSSISAAVLKSVTSLIEMWYDPQPAAAALLALVIDPSVCQTQIAFDRMVRDGKWCTEQLKGRIDVMVRGTDAGNDEEWVENLLRFKQMIQKICGIAQGSDNAQKAAAKDLLTDISKAVWNEKLCSLIACPSEFHKWLLDETDSRVIEDCPIRVLICGRNSHSRTTALSPFNYDSHIALQIGSHVVHMFSYRASANDSPAKSAVDNFAPKTSNQLAPSIAILRARSFDESNVLAVCHLQCGAVEGDNRTMTREDFKKIGAKLLALSTNWYTVMNNSCQDLVVKVVDVLGLTIDKRVFDTKFIEALVNARNAALPPTTSGGGADGASSSTSTSSSGTVAALSTQAIFVPFLGGSPQGRLKYEDFHTWCCKQSMKKDNVDYVWNKAQYRAGNLLFPQVHLPPGLPFDTIVPTKNGKLSQQ